MTARDDPTPVRKPLFGKTRERRLVVYGLLLGLGALLYLLLVTTGTFLEQGLRRGIYIAAPAFALFYGVLLVRELLGKNPLTLPTSAKK